MQILSFRKDKTTLRFSLISTFLLLTFFIVPLSALAEDAESIETLRRMGKAFAQIAEKASPAVVGLKVEKVVERDYTIREWPFGDPFERFDPFEDDIFDYFFRRQRPRQRAPRAKPRQRAQGSGFIISADGYVLTNNHLVGGADDIKVKLADGRELEAKTIGTDPESDVAVIKIDANDLPTLELADSDALEVGEWVVAIGNPFGLSHTVTAGIVSAKGRSNLGLTTYEDFIQTDAAINFGNSGGPLLNLDGKVVGINTAIVGARGNVGIGFAIPVNMAKSIYEQLIEGGTVVRGFLGVGYRELTPQLAEAFGLEEDTRGIAVTEIVEDSAAEKAGLKHNDIIIELNDEPIEKAEVFKNRIAMLKPGTEVKVLILRDDKRKTFNIKLGERPKPEQLAKEKSDTLDELGLGVQNLTDDLAERLGYKDLKGVIVTEVEPGSIAALAGIQSGMLIMEVDQKPVKNAKDFEEAIEKAVEKGNILLLINNGRNSTFIVLELPKK